MSKFQVIVADPPWKFQDKLDMSNVPRGAAANYPLLDLEEIKKLRVQEIADPNGCVLALWVPSSMLQDGLDVMKAWRFDQKQTYVWVKNKKHNFVDFKKWIRRAVLNHPQISYDKFAYKRAINAILESLNNVSLKECLAFYMGHLFRQTHEICLIGINSTKIYKSLQNKSQRSVSFGENLRHSAKPEHLQDSLELMFPRAQKLEMFARRERDDWATVGNEVCAGEDIRDSLQKLVDSINENAAA